MDQTLFGRDEELVEDERIGIGKERRVSEQVMDEERVIQDHEVCYGGSIPEPAEEAIVPAMTPAPGTARGIRG